MSFSEIIAQSKNESDLRLNQLDGIFETAFMDFEKFMSDAGLVVASHDKDNIERAIQERQGHRMCRPYYLDTRHTGLKSVAVRKQRSGKWTRHSPARSFLEQGRPGVSRRHDCGRFVARPEITLRANRRMDGRIRVVKLSYRNVGFATDFDLGHMSSGRAPLLAPSPLRTGLEGFPSSGSSTQKRPLKNEDAAGFKTN